MRRNYYYTKIQRKRKKLKQELEENNKQSLNTENYEELEREEIKEREFNESISQLKFYELEKSKERYFIKQQRESAREYTNIEI